MNELVEFRPSVSVLITTYNAMPFLVRAVEGITKQTYKNWELIIVDDHSTDETMSYLDSIEDRRIKVFTNPTKGRGRALNYGLNKCTGNYVAINDADDISLPNRLQKQVEFLDKNIDYGLVGSYSVIRDFKTGAVIQHEGQRPTDWEDIKMKFTKGQPIQHVTVLMRLELLRRIGGYNETIHFLFDRELFLRLGKITKLANLAEVLVEVGHHENRHFYYNFKGVYREYFSLKYRLTAINQFRFPKHLIIREILSSILTQVPIKIRKPIINLYKYFHEKN